MIKYLNFIGSILLGSFVVPMFYYVSNYPQFGLQDTLLVIALFGVIWLGVAGLLWIPLRDISKVSFLLYGCGTIFWFSHPLATFFRDHFEFVAAAVVKTGYQWSLLFLCCLVSVGCLFFILKYFRRFAERLNKILGGFVLILVGLLTVNGCQKILFASKGTNCTIQNKNSENSRQYPNVYHILLDAHPNQAAMEAIGGDLKRFYRELESLGFVTFPDSRSNYPATMWSVASMLSMDYLEEGWKWKSLSWARKIICANNKVFERFRKFGYDVLSGTENMMVKALYSQRSGMCCDGSHDSFFMQLYCILCSTPAKHWYENCFGKYFTKGAIDSIKNVFGRLKSAKDSYGKSANVFYTHILCPHEPCIFSKRAKSELFTGFLTEYDVSSCLKPGTQKAYRENVHGIDSLVLSTIKEILEQYKKETLKPIIVLHSDHSILYSARNLEDPLITPDTVYGNLLALYIPEEWKQDAKNLKFINLYRWIFNHLFGDDYKYFEKNEQCK